MPNLGYTRIILDYHFSEYPKDVLINANAREIVDTVTKAGTDSLIFYAKDHWGNAYYDTRIGHKHKSVSYDLFGEVLRESEKKDLNIIAYYSIRWDEYIARKNMEWRSVDKEGKRSSGKWKFLCINSPYRDYSLEQISELITNYNFPCLWVDIIMYQMDFSAPCYCPYCQLLWQEHYGGEIPKVLEGEDNACRLSRELTPL